MPILPTRTREAQLNKQGIQHVIGVDEAGRGCLAGPVVVAACILSAEIIGIKDSKLLSAKKREKLFEKITNSEGVIWNVQVVPNTVIDDINILQATFRGMRDAVQSVQEQCGVKCTALIDGNLVPPGITVQAESMVKGDMTEYIIAAASVLAKVTRDRLLVDLHQAYPEYNFAKNKGYGTAEHLKAIKQNGPCPVHRISFKTFKP
jgi:ribonuclease HII